MTQIDSSTNADPFLTACLRGWAGTLEIDATFALHARWTVLFGPSGAGKSTVLHALCGLTRLGTRHVICDRIDLTRAAPPERRFALVTQRPSLFPHLSAKENVLFSLRARNDVLSHERGSEADRLLLLFRADRLADRYPHELSGGEQQRVALARAVASRPRLLLLDEALTGLQAALREEIVAELSEWTRSSGMAILSVTHDVAETMECADAVLRIADGRVVDHGTPSEVLSAERTSLIQRLC